MKRSELRQLIKEEIQRLHEVTVTRLPGISLESDAYVHMLDVLEGNSRFSKIVAKHAKDMFSGGNPKAAFPALRKELAKIVDANLVMNVTNQINKRNPRLGIDRHNAGDDNVLNKFSGILAMGIIDSLVNDPLDRDLVKSLNDKTVEKMADEHSIGRGKSKLGTMLKSKGF